MSKLLKNLEKPSFLKNLFISILALVLAVTVLLTAVLLGSYYSSTRSITIRYFGNLIKQCNYSITYINDLAQRLSSSLIYDRSVVIFLNMDTKDNLQTVATHQAVRKTVLPLSYVDSVYLYNRPLDLVLCTKTGTQDGLDGFYDTAVIQRIRELEEDPYGSNLPFVHSVTPPGSAATSIYSYCIPDFNADGDLTSALVINISVDVLTKTLQDLSANNRNAKFAVVGPDGTLLTRSPFSSSQEQSDFNAMLAKNTASRKNEGEGLVKISGTNYFFAFTNANSNGWYIYGLIPYSVVFHDVFITAIWSIVLILLLVAVFTYATLLLARYLNRPVEAISQFVQGGISENGELQSLKSEEFRSIAKTFSQIRRENDEFSKYKHSTSRIVRKKFLESLFSGTSVYSQAECEVQMESLGCQWLMDSRVVMCLFAIDNYAQFSHENNTREREALCGQCCHRIAGRALFLRNGRAWNQQIHRCSALPCRDGSPCSGTAAQSDTGEDYSVGK